MPLLLFSVLLGGLGCLVMLALARETGLGAWAWAAALYYGIHPTLLQYARYGRPYAGAVVLSMAGLCLALACLRRPDRGRCLGLFLVGLAGAAWNHMLLLPWLGAVAAIAFVPRLRRRAGLGLWLALGGILLAHLVAVGICAAVAGGAQPLGWIAPPDAEDLATTALRLIGGKRLTFHELSWRWLLPLMTVAGLAFVLWDCLAGRRRGGAEPQAVGSAGSANSGTGRTAQAVKEAADFAWPFIAAATLAPIAGMVIATYTIQPLLLSRYLVVFVPGFILFVVRLLSRISRRGIALALAAALAAQMAGHDYYLNGRRRDGLRDCIAILEKRYAPDGNDVVLVFTSVALEAFRLFSNKTFDVFPISVRAGESEGWRIFDRETKGRKRLWVLTYRSGGGLMANPQWKAKTGERFFQKEVLQQEVLGFLLPRQAASAQ